MQFCNSAAAREVLTWDSLDDGRVWNPFEEGFSLVGYVLTAPRESREYIYSICICVYILYINIFLYFTIFILISMYIVN